MAQKPHGEAFLFLFPTALMPHFSLTHKSPITIAMNNHSFLLSAFCTGVSLCASAQQIDIPRIEQMSAPTTPVESRDWTQLTRDYDQFVYDLDLQGEYLPLVHIGDNGTNYSDIPQFYLDTYVGSFSAGRQAEAINIMPSLVGATLAGIDKSNDRGIDWVGMSRNFFNRRNGQMVYLNGYSASSGGDWWYDLMPNVYFYQLYTLYTPDAYPQWPEQFLSVADQWYNAVSILGADIYTWNTPDINYRAFNLATGQPLQSGVPEPEAAGSMAWLLYKAYLETGTLHYLQGAQLCLEALCAYPSNPSYELQLAYGAQVAAAMNAREACDFYIERLLNWCFDRGPLRGWGSIVGEWGGYNVSGLIGEANDGGNDYAFVMNGFQQAAALAPVAKYDKRFARAIGKWITLLAQSSRLFYKEGLPEQQQEAASARWLEEYDTNACLPFESMKENYDGKTPYAMGDAVKGGWAATNISLYSGSSVGYLAAVAKKSDVDGIFCIDVNATDFFSPNHVEEYLYFNPFDSNRTITCTLPQGSYDLYDVLADDYVTRSAEGSAAIEIPAGEAVMIALIPAGTETAVEGSTLYAGGKVVDYNYRYNYDKALQINALATDKTIVTPGETVTARLHVRNIPTGASIVCDWSVNGEELAGTNSAPTAQWTAADQPGIYTIAVEAYAHGESVKDSVVVEVVSEKYDAPTITEVSTTAEMPVSVASEIDVTAQIAEWRDDLAIAWEVNDGVLTQTDANHAVWLLPDEEGVYTITCTAQNRFGSDTRSLQVLARREQAGTMPLLYYPLNGNTLNAASSQLNAVNVGGTFVADSRGMEQEAFCFTSVNDKLYTPSVPEIDFTEAITLSCWFLADSKLPREQFIISHGSWEERYKLSLTPDMKLRWTVNSTGGTVDVDSKETIEAGRFYHVTAVYTGYSSEIYVNGAFSNFAPQNGSINTTSHNLCYGAKSTDETEYSLLGIMDEIRVYNTALSPQAIAELPNEWSLSAIDLPTQERLRWHKEGNTLFVTIPNTSGIASAHLYNTSGAELPCTLQSFSQSATIGVGRLLPGIYLLRLTGRNGETTLLRFAE